MWVNKFRPKPLKNNEQKKSYASVVADIKICFRGTRCLILRKSKLMS